MPCTTGTEVSGCLLSVIAAVPIRGYVVRTVHVKRPFEWTPDCTRRLPVLGTEASTRAVKENRCVSRIQRPSTLVGLRISSPHARGGFATRAFRATQLVYMCARPHHHPIFGDLYRGTNTIQSPYTKQCEAKAVRPLSEANTPLPAKQHGDSEKFPEMESYHWATRRRWTRRRESEREMRQTGYADVM